MCVLFLREAQEKAGLAHGKKYFVALCLFLPPPLGEKMSEKSEIG
jgi:hypothetical protein